MGEAPPRAADYGVNPSKAFDPQGAAAAELIGEFMQLEKDEFESTAFSFDSLYIRFL